MKLKEQLEYYLQVKGINATQLSKTAAVPRQNISNWMMNQKPKDIDQVKRVADVFGVSLDQLIYGKELRELEKEKPKDNVLEIRIFHENARILIDRKAVT